MRFEHTEEQRDFARSVDQLLASADTVAAARAWADGDHAPGLAVWGKLADQGVNALLVPEESGGLGAGATELVIALEAVGRHAPPGPWVESVAFLPAALADAGGADDLLAALAEGSVATVAAPPQTPYALDADVAEHVLLADGDGLRRATAVEELTSVDRTRLLHRVAANGAAPVTAGPPSGRALDLAALATAAQFLGAGERLLADSVAYVQQRRQFGRPIGSYQAIKHHLADVRIALDFARPLVDGAALAGEATRSRDVSAAKVACGDAAHLASRVALQLHGAIGYTAELDLSLWILKVRALTGAWGTPSFHRSRVLASLVPAGRLTMQRTEEQAELAAILRTLLDKRSGSAAVRAAAGSAAGHDEDLWRTLCEEIGAAALDVPEEYDGAGASFAESLVILEELGRSLAPSPLLASVIAVEALLACDDEDARARLLPRIAAGEVATVAFGPTNVLHGGQAAIVLAVMGDELVEVDPSVARTDTHALDITLQLARVDLGSATTRRIGGPEAVRRARDAALVGTAALQLGGMQRALNDTVAYTSQRVQFGRTIGSFQALKHRMADVLVRVEMSRSAVLAAATHQTSEAALAAASYCSESFGHVAAEMVQLHGGIAITWEHDAHLVLKRAHALGTLWGLPHEHRALVTL